MSPDDTERADRRRPEAAPLDCMAAVRRLWDYLDGELDAWDARAVDEHLAACASCAPHFAFERQFLHAVAAAGATPPEPTALRARLRRALAVEGYAGG